MNKLGFMFIGRSGCGKGTQVEYLKEFLEGKNSMKTVAAISVGANLRKFIAEKNYTAELAEKIMKEGGLQPNFLSTWSLTNGLIEKMATQTHLIIDGGPRSLVEAIIMDRMMKFYKIEKVYPILLDVSREWAKNHLLERGRGDDTPAQIEARLDYYEKDVVPVVEYYRKESKNELAEMNGEQTIEEVHSEILQKLNL